MEYKWLSSKSAGDKLQHSEFLEVVKDFDFVILSETWKHSNVEVSGYRSVIQDATKSRKGGRNSGGIVLLYKNAFQDWISIVKKSPNFLWFKINKQCAKTTKDIYTCGLYIPPTNSQYFNAELFDELERRHRILFLPRINTPHG